jgi:hypothetical protein
VRPDETRPSRDEIRRHGYLRYVRGRLGMIFSALP